MCERTWIKLNRVPLNKILENFMKKMLIHSSLQLDWMNWTTALHDELHTFYNYLKQKSVYIYLSYKCFEGKTASGKLNTRVWYTFSFSLAVFDEIAVEAEYKFWVPMKYCGLPFPYCSCIFPFHWHCFFLFYCTYEGKNHHVALNLWLSSLFIALEYFHPRNDTKILH
jgi:hypothetical protein